MFFFLIIFLIKPSYYDGLEDLHNYEYKDAIYEFRDALDDDFSDTELNVDKVKEKLKESENKYLEKIKDKLNKYETKFLYKKAKKIAKKALKVLKNKYFLRDKIYEYDLKISKIGQNIKLAKRYADNDDWEKTFSSIKDYIKYKKEFYDLRYLYKKSSKKLLNKNIKLAKNSLKKGELDLAIKFYKIALDYRPDEDVRNKLSKLENSKKAKKLYYDFLFYKNKNLFKSYTFISQAYELDKNKEYKKELKNASDKLVNFYLSKANSNIDLEKQYDYLVKAKSLNYASSDLHKKVNDKLSRGSKKLALNYYRKAKKAKTLAKAYLYYKKSYILNNKLISSRSAYEKLEKKLNSNYNLIMKLSGFNKNSKKEFLNKVLPVLKNISFNASKTPEGIITVNLKEFNFKVKKEKNPKKVSYLARFKNDENNVYSKMYDEFTSKIKELKKHNNTSLNNYLKITKTYLDDSKELVLLKHSINSYRTKEYYMQRELGNNVDKDEIKTPYDNKYSKLKVKLKNIDTDDVLDKVEENFEDSAEEIEDLFDDLLDTPKYHRVPEYKIYEYDEVVNKVIAKYDISIKAIDYLTELVLCDINEDFNYSYEFITVKGVKIHTEAGTQKLVKEIDNKVDYFRKTKNMFYDNLISKIKASRINKHGDRFYTLFKNSKNNKSKFKYAIRTYALRDYLLNKDKFLEEINKFLIKNYNLNILKSKLEFL